MPKIRTCALMHNKLIESHVMLWCFFNGLALFGVGFNYQFNTR